MIAAVPCAWRSPDGRCRSRPPTRSRGCSRWSGVISALYTGSALTTTAIGTLIPILADSGELRTRFGTFMLAAGAVGEFGPVLILTLVLSAQGTATCSRGATVSRWR